MTTVTDMMILNCAVGIDVAREGSQWNTQGVWPCKLLVDSLPLQFLDISPERLEQTTTPKISNDSCRVTHDKKQITVECNENEKNIHKYTKFDQYKIIKKGNAHQASCDPRRARHQPVWESSDTPGTPGTWH